MPPSVELVPESLESQPEFGAPFAIAFDSPSPDLELVQSSSRPAPESSTASPSSVLTPQGAVGGHGPWAGLGLVAVHRTNRADEPNPGCSRVPLPVLLVLPLLVPLQIQKADLAPIYLTSGDRRGHGILQFGFRARESREKKIEPKFPPNMFPRQFGSRCNFSGFLR